MEIKESSVSRHLVVMFAAVFVLSETAYAQQFMDVVHLKNGRIVNGIIIEQIPDETIKIQLQDGTLQVIRMAEIARIVKEPVNAYMQQLAGQRLRVTQLDGQWTGRIAGIYADGFDLATAGNNLLRYNLKDIVRLERSLGMERNVGKGLLIGCGVGTALVFATFADEVDSGRAWVGLAVLGNLVGALPGLAVGYMVKSETWENIPIAGMSGVSFSPTIDIKYDRSGYHGVFVGGSIRF